MLIGVIYTLCEHKNIIQKLIWIIKYFFMFVHYYFINQ